MAMYEGVLFEFFSINCISYLVGIPTLSVSGKITKTEKLNCFFQTIKPLILLHFQRRDISGLKTQCTRKFLIADPITGLILLTKRTLMMHNSGIWMEDTSGTSEYKSYY